MRSVFYVLFNPGEDVMHKTLLVVAVLAACVAAYTGAFSTAGVSFNSHPEPPAENEFYWDDGMRSAGWIWYTGGNYWAVQFDDLKTGGIADGAVTAYGAYVFPGWPDSHYEGCYMHVFGDDGGHPGDDLNRTYMGFSGTDSYTWLDVTVGLNTSVFYIAFEQISNYPDCDSLCIDEVVGIHNWTGFQGEWGQTTAYYGDFMLRCYWDDEDAFVEDVSWGRVKALY
jgi:hypothetical protein